MGPQFKKFMFLNFGVRLHRVIVPTDLLKATCWTTRIVSLRV